MLNRQKALVELVRLAGGRIDRRVLTEWAFLIRQETDTRGGHSFYDFVPYQSGPYSFSLCQEAQKLVSLGYLRELGHTAWGLGEVAAPAVDAIVRKDLVSISSRLRPLSADRLLDYLHDNYPHFAINGRNKRPANRPRAPVAVYTAGYEGKNVDAFLNGLTESGIAHLIDVRRNPIARRYGFHRSTLSRLCGRLGIKYDHVPQLGISSEDRKQVETKADYETLFRRYEKTTLKNERLAVDTIAEWIKESPSVLVCMEANPICCHRARLAEPVSRTTGFPIVHLD